MGIRYHLWSLNCIKKLELVKNRTRGGCNMEEKKKYKKKNDFKINFIFNEKGEELQKIIERAFGNYCLNKTK